MATATANVIQEVNERSRAYKMPEVNQGDRVLWYRARETGEGRGILSIVTMTTPDYIELACLGGHQHLQLKRQVHHTSDPRLDLGLDWTQYGTWDFLPVSHADRTVNGRVRALEQKVSRTEDTLIELQREHTELKKLLAKQAKEKPGDGS